MLDTWQVAELMFRSRPSAVRHLRVRIQAGLVWRFVHDNDSTHMAHYEVSATGVRLLAGRLHSAGLAVPVALGREHRDQFEVNEFLVGLTRAARASAGSAWLYGWRRGEDVTVWLFRLGISGVQPGAAGVWLQDGRALRFLLHVDEDHVRAGAETSAPRPVDALSGYRAASGVPAGCVLLLCPTDLREQQAHEDLAADSLPVPVATTSIDRWAKAPDPSGPIWTVTGQSRRRLIDVASS
ncbi:hypothetical protein JKJ07_44455 [Actinoplanes sp. LDG1-01]|uniref:Replication-relaxation n=1 Tax=Paractinoplanes lichenicola TaxID=2802976 RepID=A0ABS1W3P5_9ACTN|nr:hypothetical protein [Actinoplanes lichenicola]